MNAAQLLDQAFQSHAERPAFVCVDEDGRTEHVVTFARLGTLVSSVAGGLRSHGIAAGSRVLVCLPPSVERSVAMLAAIRLGAVAVVVEPRDRRPFLERAAVATDPDALIAAPKMVLTRFAHPGLRSIACAVTVGTRRIPNATRFQDLVATPVRDHVDGAVDRSDDDTAIVTFTPGASSAAAGTRRTHGALRAQHEVLAREFAFDSDARMWTDTPNLVLHALGRGAATVLPPVRMLGDHQLDPKHFHRHLVRCGATVLALTQPTLARLVRAPGRIPITAVRQLCTSGAPVMPRLFDGARALLPNAELLAFYGYPHADPLAATSSSAIDERRSTMHARGGAYVGRAAHGTDVLVVRPTAGPIEVEPGSELADWQMLDEAPGELLVSGDHVDLVPWSTEPHEDVRIVTDEHSRRWLRTGDIVRRDEDGGIWVLGRHGRGWTMGGTRRWPLEVETPIADLPEVARAAVCMPTFTGSDREFKNASAVLAVQPSDGFDRADARDAAVRVLRERGLGGIEVRSLRRIPLDAAGTRVDVAALQDKLKPENDEDY